MQKSQARNAKRCSGGIGEGECSKVLCSGTSREHFFDESAIRVGFHN